MKFSGGLYQGNKNYLVVYNFHDDVCSSKPKSIHDNLTRVAHVSYTFGRKSGGIDIFRINGDYNTLRDLREGRIKWPPIILGNADLSHVDVQNDIQYELVRGIDPELLDLVRADVDQFCRGKPSKKREGTRIVYTDRIIPKTRIMRVNPERILTPGKQEFVLSCGLKANIDFSNGCVSGWIPGRDASFDGEIFTDYFLDPSMECSYCYARPKHKTFAKTFFKIDKNRLKEELLGNCRLKTGSKAVYGKPVKILRFGKRTEATSDLTLDSLILTLEACAETGTRGVIPTKFLKFDRDTARLIKKTNSILLYSIGWDELEPGACSYGCDNEFRMEEAILHKDYGVNSNIYLLILGHAPVGEREIRMLDLAKKYGLPVQLLPVRFPSKELVKEVTGIEWDKLKKRESNLFPEEETGFEGSYFGQSGTLVLDRVHEDWLNLIGNNNESIRLCHHNLDTAWCGSCYLQKGFINGVIPRENNNFTFKKRFKKRGNKKTREARLPLNSR